MKIYTKSFLALFISFNISSESLLDIYNEALENDPTYKAAEYSYLADKELKVQGRAALLPSITLSGSTNWNEYYQNKELQQQYNSFSSSARVTQPLFRLDTWFKYRQSKSLTDAAEADFAFEQQNLLVRTAELYFGVLRAIDNLNAAISEEKAIKKQLDQAKQRFEVGLSAITGVQEAQLAFDLSKASRIRTEGSLYSARESLNALIGREIFSLNELGDSLLIDLPTPSSKQKWVELALENNYQLKAAYLRKKAAKSSARSVASNHLPKIDIVGSQSESETNQFNYEGFNIDGQGIPVPSVTGRRNYSIQLSMPLFQGGAVNSRRKQAYSQYERANENTLFTERRIIQEVRSQFSNVLTLVANVNAQKQAVVSATSALEATQVGYRVGTRNVVDLLQAEKNLYSAEKNLANAKYDYILANLRLGLASGTITPADIVKINNLLS
ncbi:TolC family outer membrane protein [Gammaproteobacteria bacterium]|jgi:outer membrane protein|nr:TolC family outer membrane protein [Gammaproteobacteria bacterium]MDA8683977.1 TolC family outer membrane protein [Gammaproteobacteria bacterium]MDA8862235.1 TolC family outer membrane protein [Gammaproteobacteria bacterium]MDA8865091.1 TolC family outer membrane protein [Gammaproteobacteria bacterium]MDA8890366.1 TolC family outer membrane protein [Gammaproteobacteria bacterium]|tara:strand:+ start:5381 stop:6709 length:1329 start_codon:yes stop_codon:yes gene_type:complete